MHQTPYKIRKMYKCPLNGNYLQNNVIYKAMIKFKGNKKNKKKKKQIHI